MDAVLNVPEWDREDGWLHPIVTNKRLERIKLALGSPSLHTCLDKAPLILWELHS